MDTPPEISGVLKLKMGFKREWIRELFRAGKDHPPPSGPNPSDRHDVIHGLDIENLPGGVFWRLCGTSSFLFNVR